MSHHPGGIDRCQTGPFAPLVDNLQKEAILLLAESYIKDTRLAIEHNNVSVRELAEASARPRSMDGQCASHETDDASFNHSTNI